MTEYISLLCTIPHIFSALMQNALRQFCYFRTTIPNQSGKIETAHAIVELQVEMLFKYFLLDALV